MFGRTILSVLIFGLGVTTSWAQDVPTLITYAAQGVVSGNLYMFEPQAAQRIAAQLGSPAGNLVYQRMAALGPVTRVIPGPSNPLPNGIMVQARAFHSNGISDWTIGYSYVTQKIAFGNFNGYPTAMGPTPVGPNQEPAPAPVGPVQKAPASGAPITTGPPPSDNVACQKYPTLC